MTDKLNALDVAAVIHQHQPITVQELALYYRVPRYIVAYAVDWLLKAGYVTKEGRGLLSVVKVGEVPNLWRDHEGKYHRLVGLVSGDAAFLERNGWTRVWQNALEEESA